MSLILPIGSAKVIVTPIRSAKVIVSRIPPIYNFVMPESSDKGFKSDLPCYYPPSLGADDVG